MRFRQIVIIKYTPLRSVNIHQLCQINGKIRAKIDVPVDISNEDAIALAKEDDKIKEELAGKNIIKEIYVKGKLVNIVAK